jgi:hypothetical protein
MNPDKLERLIDGLGKMPSTAHVFTSDCTVAELREELATRLPATSLTTISLREAEEFSDSLSDIACWLRGFRAGIGEASSDLMPLNWHVLTEINIRLKSHIRFYTKGRRHP